MYLNWGTVGLCIMGILLVLYAIFFESVIAAFDACIQSTADILGRMPHTLNAAINSRCMRLAWILILTVLLVALSSETFAKPKAPFRGFFIWQDTAIHFLGAHYWEARLAGCGTTSLSQPLRDISPRRIPTYYPLQALWPSHSQLIPASHPHPNSRSMPIRC